MGVTLTKPPCKVDDCDRPSRCKGWCDTHYRRMQRYGSPEPRVIVTEGCSVEGCDRPHNARGYCGTHYKAAIRNEWAEGRTKADSTRQIKPMGERITAGPLVQYVEALGGIAAVTSWIGTVKEVPVERWKRNYERAKVRGFLDVAVADEFCCRVLRIHPYFIWGDIWWDHEEVQQAAA